MKERKRERGKKKEKERKGKREANKKKLEQIICARSKLEYTHQHACTYKHHIST